MKKVLLAVSALFVFIGLDAQMYNVRDIVASDMDKAAGCEGPYRYDAPALTPAPKGYSPFYISHYGRHGSRFSWTADTYTVINNVLQAAKKADALTEQGEVLYQLYTDFYLTPFINTGDLVELGWEQHTNIAAAMCAQFPEVFEKGGSVVAMSSTSQRAITSMTAFCVSLQKNAPKVEIEASSLHTGMLVVNPPSAPREILERYEGAVKRPANSLSYLRERHYDDILSRLFKDRSFLEDLGGRSSFISNLFSFWAGYQNYCQDDRFENLFTLDEIVDFWEVENLGVYTSHSANRYQDIPLLRDIVERAEEAVAGGEVKGHFRFGHDTVVNAIVPLLNLNGCGYQPDKAEDVKYWFQNFNCPMAANIQFVLYRSKKNPDILFKVLLNNAEASIPQLESVDGPYYRWDDFKAWAEKIFEEHPLRKMPAASFGPLQGR